MSNFPFLLKWSELVVKWLEIQGDMMVIMWLLQCFVAQKTNIQISNFFQNEFTRTNTTKKTHTHRGNYVCMWLCANVCESGFHEVLFKTKQKNVFNLSLNKRTWHCMLSVFICFY